MSTRGWRALAFVWLAVVAVIAVGVAHLGRWPAGTAASPRPTPAARAGQWLIGLASFGDMDHGAVVMGGGSPTTGDTFVTTDGGRTWTARHVGLSATAFLDRDHAISVAATSPPSLGSSSDGGRTWARRDAPVRASSLGFLLNRSSGGPTFLNPEEGWWLDAPPTGPRPIVLWHTQDGGRTWIAVSGPGPPRAGQPGDLAFVDERTAAFVAVPASGTLPALLTTRDGGQTWAPTPLPDVPDGGGRAALASGSAAQLLAEHGRLVLSVDLNTTAGGEFSHWTSVSPDGGQTWAPWAKEPASVALSFADPVVDDAGRMLVVDDQTLWTSADDGRTWQPRPLHLPVSDHALAVVLARGDSLLLITEGAPPDGMDDLRLLRGGVGGQGWTDLRLPGRPVG